MITSLRATYKKRRMMIKDIILLQHTSLISRSCGTGSWVLTKTRKDTQVFIMEHLHYSVGYLLSDRISLSFTKRQLQNIFLSKRAGNTFNHVSVKIWTQISFHLVPWGIQVPSFPFTPAKSGACGILNLEGKGRKKKLKGQAQPEGL